jgi:hypothetical protein
VSTAGNDAPILVEGAFCRLLRVLGGTTTPLKLRFDLKPPQEFPDWKGKLQQRLFYGVLDIVKVMTPHKVPTRSTRKNFVVDLDLEALAWYVLGQQLRGVIEAMQKEYDNSQSTDQAIRESARPWTLADLFLHLTNVSFVAVSALTESKELMLSFLA